MQTVHPHTGDETAAYIEEIRQLRLRITVLESALANAEAAVKNQNPSVSAAPPITSISFTPATRPESVTEITQPRVAVAPRAGIDLDDDETTPVSKQSVFSSSDEPAVVAAADSGGSFADVWNDDESFEEKLAQRAFFEAGVIDEQSRSWLLDS